MEQIPLVGRLEEVKILENALQSPKAEMVPVISRRRVGKTFLVKSVYLDKTDFEITGIQRATRQEQLRNFMLQIAICRRYFSDDRTQRLAGSLLPDVQIFGTEKKAKR